MLPLYIYYYTVYGMFIIFNSNYLKRTKSQRIYRRHFGHCSCQQARSEQMTYSCVMWMNDILFVMWMNDALFVTWKNAILNYIMWINEVMFVMWKNVVSCDVNDWRTVCDMNEWHTGCDVIERYTFLMTNVFVMWMNGILRVMRIYNMWFEMWMNAILFMMWINCIIFVIWIDVNHITLCALNEHFLVMLVTNAKAPKYKSVVYYNYTNQDGWCISKLWINFMLVIEDNDVLAVI